MEKLRMIGKGLIQLALVTSIFVLLTLEVATADQWAKTYGGSGKEVASSIQQTTDGGYIVAGITNSFGAGNQDVWVLKLGVSGNIQWEKTYGGSGDEEAYSIQQTSEGGYIVVGSTDSFGAGKKDAWVLKLDVSGNVQWQKTYGGSGDDEAFYIQETSEGGYVVAGSTDSFGAGKKDVWVLKLDVSGNVQWQKTYGGSGDDEAFYIQETSEGGYVVAGSTDSFGAGKKDVWVLKLDVSGNVQWQKTYGGSGDEEAYSIQQTSEGGYIVAGSTDSYGNQKEDAWLLKLDVDGNIEWQMVYGGSGDDKAYSIQQVLDGGYILAGSTDSYGAGGKNAWVLKLDQNGYIQWQKTYGGSGDEEAGFIQQTLDGGYVVAGWSNSFGAGDFDAWLLKLDSGGNVPGCQTIGTSYAYPLGTTISGVSSSATIQDTNILAQMSSVSPAISGVTPGVLCMVQGPDISTHPTSVDFDSVVIGASTSQAVTIMNTGSGNLILGNLDISGTNNLEFGIRTDNCSGHTLGPSISCSVEVIFFPATKGKKTANLSIPSNDSDRSNLSVPLDGEGVSPITLSGPANHTSFSVCSLYSSPTFGWSVVSSFKNYEIQFSKTENFNSVPIKVKVFTNEIAIKSSIWKKVLLIPGEIGGPVYWRVIGFSVGGKTAFISDYSSISIEPTESVGNPQISSTSQGSFPSLSWENNCNVKFKVWFGNDGRFSKKYSIAFSIKDPIENEGGFNATLSPQQWTSARKVVEDKSGSNIYWKVESWDGANRYSVTEVMNFVLIGIAQIRLAWDPPTTNADGTPLTDLAGYKIYYGTSSGNYGTSFDVGNVTTYTLTDLTKGQAYFIVATTYDTSGNESGYSNEVNGVAVEQM